MQENQPDTHVGLLIERLAVLEARLDNLMLLEARVKRAEGRSWIVNVFGSITLVGIVGFAFFLGSMNNSITRASEKSDKIYSVVLESKDNLASRASVIESRLDTIDSRLDTMDKKLDNIDKKLESVTSQRPAMK